VSELIEELKKSNQELRNTVNGKKKEVDELRKENIELKATVSRQSSEIGRLKILAGDLGGEENEEG
jgi:FtsZ-binding cell division protein ZapB